MGAKPDFFTRGLLELEVGWVEVRSARQTYFAFKKRLYRFVHLIVTEESIDALDLPAVSGD